MEMSKVDRYTDVESALRNTDLRQALYDEGAIAMKGVLVNLHGEEHTLRRAIESRIFRRNFFRHYENDIFPLILDDTLDKYLVTKDADLKDLGYRVMVNTSLQFAGIDRQDNSVEEADTLHGLLDIFGHAATLGQHSGDREPLKKKLEEALALFRERFFLPSLKRRKDLLKLQENNEITRDDLPSDILTTVLLHADKLDISEEQIMRETAFFFLAGAHTSVHTLLHAMNEIFLWQEKKGISTEELVDDRALLQKMVHESMRLHPSSPEARRICEADTSIGSGRLLKKGERLSINLQKANRDTEIFGADADEFNVHRECPDKISRTGVTFGGGMHVCLGQNLVAGTVVKPGAHIDENNHQFGTIVMFINELLKSGIEQHPERAPEKDAYSSRDLYTSYPVRFGRTRSCDNESP